MSRLERDAIEWNERLDLDDTARLPCADAPFEDELERTQPMPAVDLRYRRVEAMLEEGDTKRWWKLSRRGK